MFRNARRLLSLYLLLLFSTSALTSQERWSGPAALEEFRFDNREIYALGWSEAGAFAYGTVTPSDTGGAHWQWFILDLIDDVLLYESPRWTLLQGQTPAELWELHPEWYPQLLRFAIIPSDTFKSGGQIFQQDGSSYRMTYTLDRSESETHPGGLTKHIRIDLFRDNNRAKTVYNYSPVEKSRVVEDMILKGYVLSPYEKRTALVTLEKSAPPGEKPVWKYRIIGAHLTVGFSAVKQKGSALAEAVLNGQYYVTRMHLAEGADPDSKDSRGFPALLIAARLGHWSMASLLLEAGASVHPVDDRGRNPLYYAVKDGEREAVRLLMKGGADADKKDLNGRSPRDLAAESGRKDLLELF